MKRFPITLLLAAALLGTIAAHARVSTSAAAIIAAAPRARVAVLDFGDSDSSRRIADALAVALQKVQPELDVPSRAQARAAARGGGYKGSLNLSLEESRDLGAALGCDFFLAGDANTLLRHATGRADYFESYAAVYLVSSFTGKLVLWERLSAEAAKADEAERNLAAQLRARAGIYAALVVKTRLAERDERRIAFERDTPVIEEAPDDGTAAAKNLRVPLPYRRLRPPYTAEAARSEVAATIDALVELDERGEVRGVEIARWAGYGLDESVAATVRQMHFRPALRAGAPIPIRVMLRYNFRRPKDQQ